jgi:F-type H+-transporting ATPase subunit delta
MSSVDKRYAEALVDVAEEKNSIDTVQTELGTFAELYSGQSEFARFFLAPEIGKKEKKDAIKGMFSGSGSVMLPFLQLLIDKDRIKNLPGIYKEYVDMADKRKKILHLEIRTFAAIDDIQLEKIKEKYMKEYDAKDVKTTVSIEPELLGGIVVQIGDRVIDGSIKGRLKGLKDTTVHMQQLRVI